MSSLSTLPKWRRNTARVLPVEPDGRTLLLRGWDAPSILSLENILNECVMSLYTPNYDTYNMQQLLRQADQVMARMA